MNIRITFTDGTSRRFSCSQEEGAVLRGLLDSVIPSPNQPLYAADYCPAFPAALALCNPDGEREYILVSTVRSICLDVAPMPRPTTPDPRGEPARGRGFAP